MPTGRRAASDIFAALPLGAVGGLTALWVHQVLEMPGAVAAAAAAAAAMTLAAVHCLVDRVGAARD